MSFFMPHPINPQFMRWYNELPDEAKQVIIGKWEETGTHPDLSPHGGTSVEYARKYRTIQFCAEKYGYRFP